MPLRPFAPYLILFVLLNTAVFGQDAATPRTKLTETTAPAPAAASAPKASSTAPATAAPAGVTPTSSASPAVLTPSPTAATSVAATAPVVRPQRFVPVLISATDSHGSPVLGLTKDQ